MKKILALILISSAMFTAIPVKKADASVFCGAYAMAASMADTGSAETIARRAFIGNVVSIAAGVTLFVTGHVGLGTVMIVLDHPNAMNANDVSTLLSARYPFIDDSSVTQQLASAIVSTYVDQKDASGNAMVSLSPDETRSILSQADLSDDEINMVIRDLQ